MNWALHNLMDEARKLNKQVVTVLPSIYGFSTTTWTATPNEYGGIELTHVINK